jgi:choline dehydrogenase-like flavoprotein
MGFPRISDVNAPDAPAEGLATFDSTVNASNQRVSTFDAFLPRTLALDREKNLTICTQTLVSRIGFSQGNGKPQAEEVFFKSVDPKQEKIYSAKVRKEVIVCSGAVGSPQVLMLRYLIFSPGLVDTPEKIEADTYQ